MSFHTYQHYTFDINPLSDYDQNNPETILRELWNQLQSRQLENSTLNSPTSIITNYLPIDP